MSQLEVDKIIPQSGTTLTIGDSGDTITITSGASISGFTSTGIDDNATSTAITIDSSENVLVGTTSYQGSASSGTGGQYIGTAGSATAFARNSANVVYVNRIGSDGSVIGIRKDGADVGNIGNNGADFYLSNSTATNGAGIILQDNLAVTPMKDSSPDTSSAVSFGTSSRKWKDLYLGGGLYVGGTGTANKLDDYEEGTFTPTVTGATSGSFTTGDSATTGSYVKIGNQVTVRGEIHITGSSSPVGAVRVGNLPFTCAALTELSERTPGSCWVKYMDLESTTRSLAVFISQLNSYFQFYETNDNANVTAINSAEVTVPGAEFAFSLTYQTS